jgi:hypothetical protein
MHGDFPHMRCPLILLAERVYALYLFVPMRVRADLFPQDLLVVLRLRLLVYLLVVPVMTNSLMFLFSVSSLVFIKQKFCCTYSAILHDENICFFFLKFVDAFPF